MKVYFSDFFDVRESALARYGAFNISLITDLPLFVDPFLLFNSRRKAYQALHDEMLDYLAFIRDEAAAGSLDDGLLKAWVHFGEVKQNWLGFTESGNGGRGLGFKFAQALRKNLQKIFSDFGKETVTRASHLEKLCLIETHVGKDMISDFTTNLIKRFLLEYTQAFAKKHIDAALRKTVMVPRAAFNGTTETWEAREYDLPWHDGDFVLLTPVDILTKDDTWINKNDLFRDFDRIPDAIENDVLRAQVNRYFLSVLPRRPKKKDKEDAIAKTVLQFPELIDYFIKYKEDRGDEAEKRSIDHVRASIALYIEQFRQLIDLLNRDTAFYRTGGKTETETRERIIFLRDVIENKGGWRVFYKNNRPVAKETDLQILFRLTWYATPSDVSREVNDGRGPVDFKISQGSGDKSLVEMKLAKNSQLERNLAHQVEIYQKASGAEHGFKVILYFTEAERRKVERVLNRLQLGEDKNVYLIDASRQTKTSASKA